MSVCLQVYTHELTVRAMNEKFSVLYEGRPGILFYYMS